MQVIVNLTITIGLLVLSIPSQPVTVAFFSQRQTSTSAPGKSNCTKEERIVFSCTLKRPAKVVSLCASRDLAKDAGYLQYRFGTPGKLELEFPTTREGSQQSFEYMHYFRFQVDMTEISFSIGGYSYSVLTITTERRNQL